MNRLGYTDDLQVRMNLLISQLELNAHPDIEWHHGPWCCARKDAPEMIDGHVFADQANVSLTDANAKIIADAHSAKWEVEPPRWRQEPSGAWWCGGWRIDEHQGSSKMEALSHLLEKHLKSLRRRGEIS